MSCQTTENLDFCLLPYKEIIQKFLKFQMLPKGGWTSLRKHKFLGNPRTYFIFVGLLRLTQARHLEGIMASAEAICTRLTTREGISKPTSHRGGWLKQMAFHHFLVPTSRANPTHASDIKAGGLATAATGMSGVNTKLLGIYCVRHSSCLSGPPLPKSIHCLSLSWFIHDIQTHLILCSLPLVYSSIFLPTLPCILGFRPQVGKLSVRGIYKYFRLEGHMVSVTTIQLCFCRTKAVLHNT